VFEAIGDDKVRVNRASWDDSRTIRPKNLYKSSLSGKTLVVTRTERPAEYLNIDPSGLADVGYGPVTK
jgi:hypothetical protein